MAADPTVDLTDLATAKAFLEAGAAGGLIVPSHAMIERMITAVSAAIQSDLGRKIPRQTHTLEFSGDGKGQKMLRNFPILSVTSLTINDRTIPASPAYTGQGYVIGGDDREWIKLRSYCFERGVENCAVTYVAGYAVIPADLALACQMGVNLMAQAPLMNPMLESEKAGDTQFVYNTALITQAARSVTLTPQISALINEYRRVAPC